MVSIVSYEEKTGFADELVLTDSRSSEHRDVSGYTFEFRVMVSRPEGEETLHTALVDFFWPS